MKKLAFILPLFMLAACGNDKQNNSQDSTPVTDTAAVKAGVSDVKELRPNIDLMPWEGNLYDAVYWRDSRGENALVISGNPQYFWAETKPELKSRLTDDQDEDTYEEATDIYARHYVLGAGESMWKLKYEYYDAMLGCCDVFMELQKPSIEILDADNDGKGDLLFTYHSTEGDGKLEGSWNGTEVLLTDSTSFTITGSSVMSGKSSPEIKTNTCPSASPYAKVMSDKWTKDCEAWAKILSAPSAE